MVFQDGDYFRRTVNLAARIADYARPGEVVVSQEVVEAADGAPVSFEEIGPVELKGVPGRHRLHTARRDASKTQELAVPGVLLTDRCANRLRRAVKAVRISV